MTKENSLLFRFHRGGLDESMETVVEINSYSHLTELVSSEWDIPISVIYFERYIYDHRINWDTYIVSVFLNGLKVPIGYFNRDPTKYEGFYVQR